MHGLQRRHRSTRPSLCSGTCGLQSLRLLSFRADVVPSYLLHATLRKYTLCSLILLTRFLHTPLWFSRIRSNKSNPCIVYDIAYIVHYFTWPWFYISWHNPFISKLLLKILNSFAIILHRIPVNSTFVFHAISINKSARMN